MCLSLGKQYGVIELTFYNLVATILKEYYGSFDHQDFQVIVLPMIKSIETNCISIWTSDGKLSLLMSYSICLLRIGGYSLMFKYWWHLPVPEDVQQ